MAVNQTIHYELATAADLSRLAIDLNEVDASTIIVGFNASTEWFPTELELARLVACARSSGRRLIAERTGGRFAERAVMLGFQDIAVVSDSPSVNQQTTSSLRMASEDATSVLPDTSSIGPDEQPTTVVSATVASDQNEQPTAVVPPSERFQDTDSLATYRPQTVPEPSSSSTSDPGSETVTAPDSDSKTDATSESDLIGPPLPAAFLAESEVESQHRENSRRSSHVSARGRVSEKPIPAPVEIGRLPSSESSAVPCESPPSAIAELPRRSHRSRRAMLKISAAILAPILVLGVIAAILVYMLPTATVTLVPREESISSTLTYGVASTTIDLDVAIDPERVASTSTAEAARNATGERFEAVGTAGGTIQITNPLPHEVTIPAGTELPGPQGVMYYTAQDVQLSAADPYGSMSFGSGAVGVYAGVIGPDGNIDAGLLTGQLGNQMFYTNPEGIWGGRLEQYSVLTEDDIQSVRQSVADELSGIVEDEFYAQIPDGFEIVPGTLSISEPEIQVSGVAGEDAQQVTASGSISIEAYVYDPAELHQLAGDEADRQLARQGGSERILLAETVTLKEPTELGSADPAFQINVEAIARTVITEAEREQLLQEITGISREDAEALLQSNPKVDRYEIVIEPDWFFDRMPEITSRISIHVSSGDQTASR